MRRSSRSRGSTCVEIAILLGVIGALIIFVAGIGLRKFELAHGMHHAGRMCL
jgi:multisubunit Na+/H+ antiporter MnhG subunit